MGDNFSRRNQEFTVVEEHFIKIKSNFHVINFDKELESFISEVGGEVICHNFRYIILNKNNA